MSWAQPLQRVFAIEIETCVRCQGRLRVIASIEEPEVIARILAYRERDCGAAEPELAPIAARVPPQQGRLGKRGMRAPCRPERAGSRADQAVAETVIGRR